MNAEEGLAITRLIRAGFPAQRWDEYTTDMWVAALIDEDFGEIRAAIERLVKLQSFASIAEVIGEAKRVRRDALRRVKDAETFRAIEAAKDYDQQRAEQARLDARAAFDKAIEEAKRNRRTA